jgi:rhomboid protease GluP
MIQEKINIYLAEKGFHSIEVNVKDIYLHSVILGREIYVVEVVNYQTGTEFTSEQYKNIQRQIYDKFTQKYELVQVLTIVCTNQIGIVRQLIEDGSEQWVIDEVNNKLIIYENQRGEFLDLKKGIENILFQNDVAQANTRTNLNSWYEDNNETLYQDKGSSSKKIRRTGYFSKCNTFIVIINVIVFLIVNHKGSSIQSNNLLEAGALYWPVMKQYGEYYRLFTYMFLHSGIEHLANNMLVLLFIGDNLERAAGLWKYIVIYFGAGVIAGITSLSYNMLNGTYVISVGASGAIFGVVGAMVYIVIRNKGRLENISSRQIVMFVVLSLYSGLTSQGIDNAAHIGGLVSGIILAAVIYRKPKNKLLERG